MRTTSVSITALIEELAKLPGIGPKTAQPYRPGATAGRGDHARQGERDPVLDLLQYHRVGPLPDLRR
jgi:hypothetical protein